MWGDGLYDIAGNVSEWVLNRAMEAIYLDKLNLLNKLYIKINLLNKLYIKKIIIF